MLKEVIVNRILSKPKYVPDTYIQYVEIEYLLKDEIKRGKIFSSDYDLECVNNGDYVVVKEG